jgi:ParB family chromosome partitioning protein
MATEAERLLAGSGWLPEPLRMEGAVATDHAGTADGVESDALPDFLSGDGEDGEALEEEEQEPRHSIAAE